MVDRGLFDAARQVITVEDLAGKETDLVKAGSERRGQCPLCGAGKKKSPTAHFAVKPAKQTWRCYGCERFGDVVDLEQALRGGTLVEAARRLTGDAPLPARTNKPEPRPQRDEGPSASDRTAEALWRQSRPIMGTPAERYLIARCIHPAVIAASASALRFHPNAKWGWDEATGQTINAPAMLVQVVTAGPLGETVPTGGIHCTYLARDGRAKAALAPAKRMWGPQHVAGVMGGARLIGPAQATAPRRAGAGEGVETILSLISLEYSRTGEIRQAFAALSLDRLQGGLLRDNEGCIDPYAPQANPERPPFTWPGPWDDAMVAVDRDMSPLRVKARTPRGRTCEFTLEAETRARLCARLAGAAWKAAGSAQVRAVAPSPGSDFNDELRRLVARFPHPASDPA